MAITYTSGAGTQRRDKVRDGEYNIAVVGAEEKTSKSGNPMIELKIEVLGPIGGEQFEENTGPIIWDNLVFIDSCAWKIDQFRAACGEDVTEGEQVSIEADDLIGAALKGHIVTGQSNSGKERNEIGAYLSSNEPF